MEAKSSVQVCPTPAELSSICSQVKCPESNCLAIFQSTSNLNMHLIKHHKVENNGLTTKKNIQFFCPGNPCQYNKNSGKHFTKLKYLKQHFLKVHAVKEYSCPICGKKFSTITFQKSHMKNCGKVFTCLCGSNYTSVEAILTHCKRKGTGHSVVQSEVQNQNKCVADTVPLKNEANVKKSERVIYPKLTNSDITFPIHYIAAMALSELSTQCNLSKVIDRGIQTESTHFCLSKQPKGGLGAFKCEKKKKNSQQTQTIGRVKKMKISTETQTNAEYIKNKNKDNLKVISRKKKKSMETQTKEYPKKVKSVQSDSVVLENGVNYLKNEITSINEKIDFIEDDKPKDVFDNDQPEKYLWNNQFLTHRNLSDTAEDNEVNKLFEENERLSMCGSEVDLNELNLESRNNKTGFTSTQASENQIFDLRLCNIETQTDIDSFFSICSNDGPFCSTETQTADNFDSLLYSNMCTQTCEEVDQLFNFNFVNIETQTAWPDLSDCSNLD